MLDLGEIGTPLTVPGVLGPTGSAALDISDLGVIVGFATHDSTYHRAVSWASGTEPLRPADAAVIGVPSLARAVNNGDVLVGMSMVGDDVEAVMWSGDGTVTPLGRIGGARSEAFDVNETGAVVGYTHVDSTSSERAFLWTSGDGMIVLPGRPAQMNSRALGINDDGLVVGYSADSTATLAVAWTDSGVVALTGLGGINSTATAVSASGTIVGWANLDDVVVRACAWDSVGVADLGALPSAELSVALDVSDAGIIVGYSETDTLPPMYGRDHATIWRGAGAEDLNGLIAESPQWTLSQATGINESGDIVGFGFNPDSLWHAFLLTPALSDVPLAPDPPRISARVVANPFSHRVLILLTIGGPHSGSPAVEIFDVRGRRIRRSSSLRQSDVLWTFAWDGKDDAGLDVASGTYLYRASLPGTIHRAEGKLTLMR